MTASIDSTSPAIQTALRSINTQVERLNEAAAKIASGEGDVVENYVEMKSAEMTAKFSAAVARTAMDMQESVLDILA